ncbi:hypothetical protein VSR68_03375 [Paraburkholderia phymatum]|uniref:hypothetical protein n=1 Tax=Paraburkholderia phymatum TaxID=148447 RepID=UPI00317367E3
MSLYERLETMAIETGETIGVEINGRLLALVVIAEGMAWAIDGLAITPDDARQILANAGV